METVGNHQNQPQLPVQKREKAAQLAYPETGFGAVLLSGQHKCLLRSPVQQAERVAKQSEFRRWFESQGKRFKRYKPLEVETEREAKRHVRASRICDKRTAPKGHSQAAGPEKTSLPPRVLARILQDSVHYPINLELCDGGYVVSFPDIPEAHTQGDTREEAGAMGLGVLLFCAFYFEAQQSVSEPGDIAGDFVEVPSSVAAKGLMRNLIK